MYENVINWFEIPVADMDRAIKFYEPVMQVRCVAKMDCAELAVFPHRIRTGGALAKFDGITPSRRALLFTCILTIWRPRSIASPLRASACLARWNCRMVLAPSRCLPTARVTASASINLPEREDMTRRADRLFQIVQILRGRRLTTAAHLADRLACPSARLPRYPRSVASGVPVEGEAGSGYRLMSGFDLPPLMLTTKESEALIAAIRLLKTWGGESLSRELESARRSAGDPAGGESSQGGADADLPRFLHAKPLPQRF
jgi:hypothetical protein